MPPRRGRRNAARAAATTLAAATAFVLVAVPQPAGAAEVLAGAAGAGDPYFPLAGNGGYDVAHYGLSLDFDPATRHLAGRATIRATATQDLDRFDLDLRGFVVSRTTVNGQPAGVARNGQELVITPSARLRAGSPFTVVVRYAGTPQVVVDPDESIEGWVPTEDGAFVVGEPQGAPSWFPCNDHPVDKARFDVRVTVPAGTVAMGNGVLVSATTAGGRSTFVWRQREPMATYLATVTSGRFAVTRGRTAGGIPVINAVDPSQAAAAAPVLAKLPAMVDYFASVFGPYPFASVGAIVDYAPEVGYALETQTRPVFDSAPSESLLAHEIAHQWFGDSVSPRWWRQMWLNEGFATWSEWLWGEHNGGPTTQQVFERLYATPESDLAFWNPPPRRIGKPGRLFDGTVYDRGAMTLQALRHKLGDAVFFAILRDWAAQHRYGLATTRQFRELAERRSGQDLDAFFYAWLFRPGKPTRW